MEPPPEARVEAKLNPGGWVYAIDGDSDLDGAVPPEAILGVWRVDDAGEIVGAFIPNPNFVPRHPKQKAGVMGETEAEKPDTTPDSTA